MTPSPAQSADADNGPRRVIRIEFTPRSIVSVLVVVTAIWLLSQLVPVLLVLVASLMFVGALNHLVRWLEAHRFPRLLAIGVVLGGVVGVVVLVAAVTLPSLGNQVGSLIDHEPEIRENVAAHLDRSPLTRTLAEDVRNADYSKLLKSSQSSLLSGSVRVFELAAYSVAVVFLALYIMADRDRLQAAIFSVVPRQHHVRFSRILLRLETIVGGYIRGQVITCALITVFILALLLICRVPNALALAVFGGLMDVLPYIGPLLTIIPAVAAAYAVGPGVAITVLILLVAYEEFEGRILIPFVYGRALRLPSSVVFFALLVGAGLNGIIGALLALPIAAAAIMLVEELRVDLPGQSQGPDDIAVKRQDEREEREYERRTETAPVEDASAVAVDIARKHKAREEERSAAEDDKH